MWSLVGRTQQHHKALARGDNEKLWNFAGKRSVRQDVCPNINKSAPKARWQNRCLVQPCVAPKNEVAYIPRHGLTIVGFLALVVTPSRSSSFVARSSFRGFPVAPIGIGH